jgi:hypothetical protein
MSDNVEQCPTCGGAVEREQNEIGEQLKATMSVGQVALALDNEATCAAIAQLMPPELRLAIASVMLQSQGEPFFTPDDVRDEAASAFNCDRVVKMARDRRQFDTAAEWSVLGERHRKRAKRIMLLLSNTEQQMLQQQIHAGPLGDPPRSPIEVVKS